MESGIKMGNIMNDLYESIKSKDKIKGKYILSETMFVKSSKVDLKKRRNSVLQIVKI